MTVKVVLGWLETLVEDGDWETVRRLVAVGAEDSVIADSLLEVKEIPKLGRVEVVKSVYWSLVNWPEDVPSSPD